MRESRSEWRQRSSSLADQPISGPKADVVVQRSFTGSDGPPKATDRLFLAIRPDAEAAGRIAQLAQRLRVAHGLKGRPLGVARFHITLFLLGDFAGVPPDVLATASRAAESIAMAPFEVEFDRVRSFARARNRPWVMGGGKGLAGVVALHDALGDALKKTPLGHVVKPAYLPHLTLLYDDRGLVEQPIEPVRWIAQEFMLVRSLLGQGVHLPLARWPLRAA